MTNALLIHNNNTPLKKVIDNQIVFNPTVDDLSENDIDGFISKTVMPQIKEKEFQIIYIKDNLSVNYLDFYGLILAYHIRFELGAEKFVPIVILSEIDAYTINRLTPLGAILFTKNLFLTENSLNGIDKFKDFQSKVVLSDEYRQGFLNKIEIEAPKDYLSHHDISNEWAIYRWAEFLKIDNSKAIDTNREKIASTLYFKYLLAKNSISKKENNSIIYPEKDGKILYIDDEWDKGWGNILSNLFSNINFETLEYSFQDKNKFSMRSEIKNKIIEKNPDLIILDLRLSKSDHDEKTEIEDYTGIQLLKTIKEINQGIQVVMMTATSKSMILEKLYDVGILGYVKKEHPEDFSIDTIDNINKLSVLVEKGLEEKYLKKIWKTSQDILELNLSEEINFEVKSVFEILDSDMGNKFNYAMFAIFKCIEIVTSLYIEEKDRKACWIEGTEINNTGYYPKRKDYNTSNIEHIESENKKYYNYTGNISIENKIRTIMNEKLGLKSNELHSHIKCLVCIRNHTIHQDKQYDDRDFCKRVVEEKISKEDILIWFKMLQTILKKIDK